MFIRYILCLVVFFTIHASADTFKFCFEDWEPYASVDKNGKASGTTVDIVQEALK